MLVPRRMFLKLTVAAAVALERETNELLVSTVRAAGKQEKEVNVASATTAEIDAYEYWNRTGLIVTKGTRYSYKTEGEWNDASNRCDADGWVPKWGEPWVRLLYFKRERGEPLFKLMGAVDKNRPYIVLGTKGSFIAPASGELFCFANDVPGFYWNNSGKIKLEIVRA